MGFKYNNIRVLLDKDLIVVNYFLFKFLNLRCIFFINIYFLGSFRRVIFVYVGIVCIIVISIL